ncbi:unnamed protein product, partial [Ectocarpus sp. 13 AM-2016]
FTTPPSRPRKTSWCARLRVRARRTWLCSPFCRQGSTSEEVPSTAAASRPSTWPP